MFGRGIFFRSAAPRLNCAKSLIDRRPFHLTLKLRDTSASERHSSSTPVPSAINKPSSSLNHSNELSITIEQQSNESLVPSTEMVKAKRKPLPLLDKHIIMEKLKAHLSTSSARTILIVTGRK